MSVDVREVEEVDEAPPETEEETPAPEPEPGADEEEQNDGGDDGDGGDGGGDDDDDDRDWGDDWDYDGLIGREREAAVDAPLAALTDAQIAEANHIAWNNQIVITNGRDMGTVMVELYDHEAFVTYYGMGRTLVDALQDLWRARVRGYEEREQELRRAAQAWPTSAYAGIMASMPRTDDDTAGGISAAYNSAAADGAEESAALGADEWAGQGEYEEAMQRQGWYIAKDGQTWPPTRRGCNILVAGAFLALGGWLLSVVLIAVLAAHGWL